MAPVLYDTIIIGAGPAGAAAAVYAARKRLKTLLVAPSFGGQSVVSSQIENWLGEPAITGKDLSARLEKHVRAQKGIKIKVREKIIAIDERPDCTFGVKTDKGDAYAGKTLIIASGGRQKHLDVPGEKKFDGKGVAYCTTCDAPFFEGVDVAVVGSGNSALGEVIDLASYASKIYLLIRGTKLKGDPVNEKKATSFPQLQVIKNAVVEEILGDKTVTGLRYRDEKSGQVKELSVKGVFVAIGNYPNSEFMARLVDMNQAGEILVNFKTAETSRKGIFAAGNVTDDPYKQNNIAAGDGVRAAISAYSYVLNIKKYSPCSLEKD